MMRDGLPRLAARQGFFLAKKGDTILALRVACFERVAR